ncbi:MAG: asparagine synthase (glutamine-hydrolyzing) [Eubacterium sp.]|nr:asparagine synthase (glutamine-hydrolyzing) [Eubacterium sp.]
MCGFSGYFGTGEYDREEVVRKMSEKIAHRGPDGDGIFVDDHVALGHRRLSIIDLEYGIQPMFSADKRYVIVFNGEIYNYKDIQRKLSKDHGVTFQTNSDTEAILQTYQIYGEKTASLLRGMFAFVIYDTKEHKIYGARDAFGIKPFYYAKMKDTLLFGSEIKSFLPHPAFKKEVNREALKMYLVFQYSPMKETLFRNVYKLEPGNYFTYDGERMKTQQYFNASFRPKEMTEEEAAEGIFKEVDNSVKYHLIADVEVGSFLSGGVDSSFIATMARPDKTYSVGFKTDGFDESMDAKALCDILKIKNKRREITADEFFEALPAVQYQSDEPHANLSAVPLYFLSEMAAQDLKVVLSGEGADEFFGGYETYHGSKSGNVYKKIMPRKIRKKIGQWIGDRDHRGLNFFKRNALNLEDSYIGQAFIMDNEQANELLQENYRSDITYQDVTRPYFEKVKGRDELHKKMYLDMHLWLPNDILLKADKMTMAHSLELRVPYLDRKVWSYARTLPSNLLLDDHQTKTVFRKSSDKVLPEEWVKRKKKGFPVPIRQWLWEEKYASKFREMFNQPFASEFFHTDILLQWLKDHQEKKANNQRKLYTVCAFLLWYKAYFVDEA